MRSVYLDNNSTTPVLPAVFEAMAPYFLTQYGNASSIHHHGREALAAIKQARASVASLLGCRPMEIVFTSGGTESDNLAILGSVTAGDHIITSRIEHSAVSQPCRSLERLGCEVTRVPVDSQGQVNPEDVRRALLSDTRLISVMLANNETGVLQPVEEVGRIAAGANVRFHIDAVQAAGKVPIDVERFRCDLLTISGHKMHAPKGTGALFVKRGVPIKAQFQGGRQENCRRPGTENVPGIVGLGKACEIALEGLNDGTMDRLGMWRDRIETSILDLIPDTGINGRGAARVPNTTNIHFDHIGGDSLVLALDEAGIAVSRGAACHSGEQEPSSVLMAMGLSGERSRSSLRFSLGKQNTAEDVDCLLSCLPAVVARLREAAPFYHRPVNS